MHLTGLSGQLDVGKQEREFKDEAQLSDLGNQVNVGIIHWHRLTIQGEEQIWGKKTNSIVAGLILKSLYVSQEKITHWQWEIQISNLSEKANLV